MMVRKPLLAIFSSAAIKRKHPLRTVGMVVEPRYESCEAETETAPMFSDAKRASICLTWR
jgi:hypothetical protein